MPRFAANLSLLFTELPFLDRFAAASDAGFDAVEFLFPYDFDPDAIAKRLQYNRLDQALFNSPPGDFAAGDRGLAADPARAAEFRQSIERMVPYLQATGAPKLHLMSGNADPNDPKVIANFRRNIVHAADRLAEYGVVLGLEPLNRRDFPGYFLDDFDRAAALVAEIGHPHLKLQYDIYHRQMMRGDVIAGLRELFPIVSHIQVASAPGRHEPDAGELNDSRVFAEIDALGYDGIVGAEYKPRAGTLAGLGWFTPYRKRG
jgi:hydroxypyruvate isomerase